MRENCSYEQCFSFDVIKIKDGLEMPIFTDKNIALVKAFLKYNSSYSAAENGEEGSYSYILESNPDEFFSCLGKELEKHHITNLTNKELQEYDEYGQKKDALYSVVEDIDRVNSTHLAAEGQTKGANKGRVKTANEIRSILNLKELLLESNTDIIERIANAGGKNNFSFATKFCAYVSRHALKVDNYCIYDEVVQSILPYYAKLYAEDIEYKYYKIVNEKNPKKRYIKSSVCDLKDKKSGYKEYKELVDAIIKGIEQKDGTIVSYEDFDHILWYYFKGSKSKVQAIMNTIE